jgi:hypothetical protein
MKRYIYKRIDTVTHIKELKEAGRSTVDTEEILIFYCANHGWELATVAFDGDGHEIIYLRREC